MFYYKIGDERITTERLQERSAPSLLGFSQSCCCYYVLSGIFPVMLFFHVHSHVLVLLSFPGFSCLCFFYETFLEPIRIRDRSFVVLLVGIHLGSTVRSTIHNECTVDSEPNIHPSAAI